MPSTSRAQSSETDSIIDQLHVDHHSLEVVKHGVQNSIGKEPL